MLEINHPVLLFQNQKIFVKKRQNLPKNEWLKGADVVVIFFEKNNEWKQDWEEMLNKLVAACGFKPENMLRINVASERFVLSEIQKEINTKLMLLFGDFSITNNMSEIPRNFPFCLSGSVIIRTVDLSGIVTDKIQKSKLWGALQSGLNLKK